ncbi:MAG: calcium-translocating P-type ATPase, PMCA-type [Clostridia bacterium]|nr:calcium-translocating P-type ATPase, PMCA-type [Clostridia bacterium]
MCSNLNIEETERCFSTNIKKGLIKEEVRNRQERYGKNKLRDKAKDSIIIRFIKQFNDFMIIILIIASVVSALVSFMQGENDYFDSIIIIAIVVFNAIMGLIQEEKAEKSIEALKQMTPQLAKVIRDGKVEHINAEELVPGDVVILEAGNNVPADCRIIESNNLKIEESSLTGETIPVEKSTDVIKKQDANIGDMVNLAFMATVVVNGHGKAVVTKTGMDTRVGKIANMIIEDKSPETPIQRKLSEVGKILGITCLIICFAIFTIGLLKKIEPIEMFMTSVGLAVAAIPEGLPAIVTIMLSIGVTKMARKNSIIRKLPAVETLGSSSVICSDKTGTLTQNKMKVVKIESENSKFAIELAAMCTDCIVSYREGKTYVDGEPTETAIVEEGLKRNINKNELYAGMERVADIPFDSNRKMMTTIHKVGNKYRVITKGASDVLLNRCTKIYKHGEAKYIENSDIDRIINANDKMANEALRVIAVSYVDLDELPSIITENSIEKELIFVGLIGMIDPPREGVKEAVRTCKKAGIKTVMITGDHIATANAIAKDLGILKIGEKSITGAELDKMSQKELERDITYYSVFARVTPEHKVRIVKAWQSTGAVVAMTGDGVNDSPALKNADIGIAMGKNGTDVAKNAADMILTDDNFVTIVEAVKQGRNIYDNIKKAVHFLIATNIGEIVTIFMGLVLGLKAPLLAIQLLWINLVTDSIPAIALGLEPAETGIMQRKPRDSRKGLFADGLWSKIVLEGIMIGMLTLFAFSLGNNMYSLEVGRTMAFVSLGLLELIHCFNIKSEQSIFKISIFDNKYLIGSFILGTLIQVIVVLVPIFANIFSLVPLNSTQWIYTIAISLLPIPIMELQKKLNELKFGKVVYDESITNL